MEPKADEKPEGVPKTGTGSLLEGFAANESRTLIQENVYIILGHGRFQQTVMVCTVFSLILLLMHAFAYRLIGRPVDHWCQPPSEFRDWPVQQWKNVAIPVLADGSFSKCTMYDPPIPDDGQEERREVPCHRWDYDTTDVGDSIVSMWDLVCENSWLYSISSSVYMLGSLCLVPVAGIVADREGRRPVILASGAVMLFASIAAGSTQAFGVFLMARFAVSAAASATSVLNFIVLYEVTGSEHRAMYILLANGIATMVTPGLFSLLSLLRPAWNLSHALLVSATAAVLTWCYCLDESPVWQLATGRVRQAECTVLQAAKSNGVDMAKARATFRALRRQLEKRETGSSMGSSGLDGIYLAASFRRRAVSIFFAWFGITFIYYGARMGNTILDRNWEISAHLFKIVLLIILYYSMKSRGQRVTLSAVLALLVACCAFQTVSYNWKLSIAMPLSTLTVFSASTAAICVNYGYTAEVFPTAVRSVGFCIAYSIGRVGALLATLINAFAGNQRVLTLNIGMTVLGFFSAMAIQWLPEISAHIKKEADPVTLDEQQRREALKASLDPLQVSPKAGRSKKPHGHRKFKGVPTSPGASASAVQSAVTSPATSPGAMSPESGFSPPRKSGTSSRKARVRLNKDGSAGPERQESGSRSRHIGRPEEKAALPSQEPGSSLQNAKSPSQNVCSPSEVSSKQND